MADICLSIPSFAEYLRCATYQGPTFTADAVLGRAGALVGAEATYDVLAGAITRYAGAVGYSAADYSVAVSFEPEFPSKVAASETD